MNFLRKTLALSLFITLLSQVSFAQEEFSMDKTYSMSSTGTIYLDSDDAEVTIMGSERNDVRVKVYRKVTVKGIGGDGDFEFQVKERSGDLDMRGVESGSNVRMGYSSEDYTIEISAPFGVSLDIDGDDDSYVISKIDGDIKIDIDDGDVEIKSCGSKNFVFDIDDGDIEVDEGRGRLSVDIDDGDLKVVRGKFDYIRADIDDADIYLNTSLNDDGEYNFSASDGLIDLTFTSGGGIVDIRHDDSNVNTSGDWDMTYKTEDRTKVTMAGGSANVSIRADDARIRLSN